LVAANKRLFIAFTFGGLLLRLGIFSFSLGKIIFKINFIRGNGKRIIFLL